MKKIKKHQFGAVSLLTSQGGLLDISVIPVVGQPSWLIPTALILDINDVDKFIDNYPWQGQNIAVYHLLPKEITPKKLIILEGNTPVHRIALQTSADISTKQCKISDVKDTELPDNFLDLGVESKITIPELTIADEVISIPFIYQTVKVDGEIYIVPDIDMIVTQLVELDS
ncbi:MAG: hypothetical protein KGV51_07355 [Moraxellaceae bacterium]|nr:hypothetical protein [Moraxellaceae bacterium]